MQRVNVSLLCLLSLSYAGSVFAQQTADPAGIASLQNYSGGASSGSGSYFNIRHMTGDGVGYHGGYSQIGVFTPFWLDDDSFIAPDARLMITNNSQVGGNLGGVARKYFSGMDRIVGAYGYFDTDQSSLANRYNQASFGLETLGQGWDMRGNGYIALGNHDNTIGNGAALCVSGDPYFGGNNILFRGQQAQYREQSLSGGDWEIGVPVSRATPWLRAYAGAYAYSSTQLAPVQTDDPVRNYTVKTPVGARLKLNAWISNDLLVGVNATTDAVWGTNVNFMADFRFSGFGPTRYFPQFTTRERMLAPVERNWRIAVDQYVTAVNHDVVAVNPTTGKPYFITFIDNLKTPTPGGGNGTFEDPYNSFNHPGGIPKANIILVEKGTSTATNPYIGSMKLFDNQRLLGEGAITQKLALKATYGNCTIDSVFNVPTTGSGTNHPFVLSNSGLPPVTLANNNEVAGFTIVNQNGNVIGGDPSNINLHDLTILNSSASVPAISITNLTGNNNIIQNVNINTPGGIGNNEGGGIYLQSGVVGAKLTMTNVFMNSTAPYSPGGQQPFGIWLNAPAPGAASNPNSGGPFVATLTNVHTDGNVVGLKLTETGQNMQVTLNNVTSSNNTAQGILATGNGGSITLTANTVGGPLVASGNGGSNLAVTMINGGNFTGTFANALFNNSTGGSGIAVSETGGTATLNLTGTEMSGNKLDGLGLTAAGGATIKVTGSNDLLGGNGRDGIYNVATGASSITETLTGNTFINGNTGDGVFYNLTTGSSFTGTFTGDSVNSNKISAFYGVLNNSTANLTISGTSATNSGKDGFYLNESNASKFTGAITNSQFDSSAAGNGMVYVLDGLGTTATVNLTGTTVNSNLLNGVSFSANHQSVYTMTAVGSTFNGNFANGFIGSLVNGSTGNLTTSTSVANPTSSISGNTVNGVFVTATTGANFKGAFANTAINSNTNGSGINLNLSASPASTLSLTGTTSLNQNNAYGLLVNATHATVFTPTLSGTSIQGNGKDGVNLTALTDADIGTVGSQGTFTNVLIRDNKGNGVVSTVTGAGSTSNLLFTNAQITNTSGKSPQQIGYLYNVTGGGQLTTSFAGTTSLANNAQNALNGNVAGTGAAGSSIANITLTGTNASGSGQSNAILTDSAGGLLNFTASGGTSFSNSVAGSGLIVTSTGPNSVANVSLTKVTDNGNANGTGYAGSALAGASLNSCLISSSFSSNAIGLGIAVDGAGSTALYGVGTTTAGTGDTVNSNTMQGLLAGVTNAGQLDYRSVGSTYNANGTGATKYDGVDMRVDASTGVTKSTILALFDAGSASSNGRDGFHFGGLTDGASTNGANLTVNLNDGVAAASNGRDALNFNAGGSTNAYLLLDTVKPPVLTGPVNLNFAGSTNAVANLTGKFQWNNSTGNGLTADFHGATNAVFSLDGQGTSTANNNTLGGISVNMDNTKTASVLITGFSSISGNKGGDGISVSMQDAAVGTGAIQLQGILTGSGTTMTGNAGKGVNVQLTNVNLVNGFVPTLPTITGLTTAPAGNQLFNACLPLPVTLAVNAGAVPATGLTVNNFNVAKSLTITGTGGIYVDGTNATIASGGSISSNTISNMNGDGIQLQLHNSALVTTADSFAFTGNSSTSNSGNGINIDLLNATMNNLNLTGTTNASSNGMDGLRINLVDSSMTPTTGPATFTASSNGTNGVEINSTNGSNLFLDLGKLTANSNKTGAGFLGTATTGISGGSTLNISLETPSSLSSNGTQGLGLTVTGAGSASNFNVNGLTANANKNQGLLAAVSGGSVLNYRSANSFYNGNGTAVASDGVNLQVDGGTSVLHALFTGDTANGNSQDGFHISGLNGASTVNGANVTVNMSGVTAGIAGKLNTRDSLNMDTGSATSAYLLMDPTTPPTTPSMLNGAANLNFANVKNAIASLTGTFNFNNSATSNGLTANFSNNILTPATTAILYVNDTTGNSTASGNHLGGINVNMTNATNSSVLINGFKDVSYNKGGDGIGVTMSRTTPGNGALELQGVGVPGGTTVYGNSGNGINVQLTNMNLVSGYSPVLPTVTGLTTGNNILNPAYLGALPAPTPVTVPTSVPATAFSVNNFTVGKSTIAASGNGAGGIIVDGTNTKFTTGSGSMSNNSVWGSKGGDGIQLQLHNSALVTTADSFAFTGNSSTSNSGNGINIDLVKATMNNLNLTGTTTVTGNTQDGLHINLDGSSMTQTGNTMTTGVVINASSNKTNGVYLNAINGSNVFLDANKLTANSNTGGAGLTGTAMGGSTLNVCLDTGSSLSSNSLQGMNITLDGANSVGSFNINGTSVNSNTQQGVLATVTNAAQLNYRSTGGTTYNSNGTGATKYDGVDMRVDASSGATKSTLLTLFDNNSAIGNSRDGIHVGGLTDGASTNGAIVTVSLADGTTLSGTGGRYALNFDALAATSANLVMDGTTVLTGPTNVNVNNVTTQVVLQLIGTSFNSNGGGDGLNLVFDHSVSGIQTVFISLNGLGTSTIDGNNGNGVSVTMKGLTNGSFLLQNYKSISNNKLDGVVVSMTDVKNGAVEIEGMSPAAKTTMSNNGHDAVDIQLTRTSLVNSLGALTAVPGLLTSNLPNSNQGPPGSLNCLPAPTSLPVAPLNVIPSVALKVDSLNISGSGSTGGTGGIMATGVDSTIAAKNAFFTNNTVTGSTNGGGIGVMLTNNTVINQTIDTVNFQNNTVTNNSGDGIAFKLTNTAAGGTITAKNLIFSGNTVTGNTGLGINDTLVNNGAANSVVATGSQITGNTVSMNKLGGILDSITNNAASSLTADNRQLSGNTVTSNIGDGIVFQLTNGATGKSFSANNLQINSNTVTGNTGTGNGIVDSITNNSAGFTVSATGTQIGNSAATGNTVTGNNGIGITDTITNNAAATQVTATGTQISFNTVSTNKLGGILDSISNNAATVIVADNQQLNSNKVTNNIGDGIVFKLANGASGKSFSANNLQINSNTVTGNTGSGNGIVDSITNNAAGVTISATGTQIGASVATGNTVTGNNGIGISDTITNNAAATSVTATGTQINNNTVNLNKAGGILDSINNTVATTTNAINTVINNNTVNSNTNFGIQESILNGVGKTTNASGLQISGNTVTGNTVGEGILSVLGGGATITANTVSFASNTVTNNGSDGVELEWTNVTNTGLTFYNTSSTNNKGAGSGLLLDLKNTKLTTVTLDTTTMTGNTGNGISALLNASSITGMTGTRANLSTNTLNGLNVVATNASLLTGATFTTATITGNTLDGVHLDAIDGTKSTFGTAVSPINFTTSTITNNKSDGVDVSLAAMSLANMKFNNDTIGNTAGKAPQQNGLLYDIAATGGVFNATFTGGTVSNNAVDAIHGTILGTGTANQSSSTVSLSGTTADGSGSTGALFTLNNASLLNFTMTNASSISGSGADGVQINARDLSTRVVGTFTNSFINNNGATVAGNGLTGNFDNNATGLLNFTTMQIMNSAVGGTQQDGVMLNVNQNTVAANTDVIANFTTTNLSNNANTALEGFITGVAGGINPTKGAHITFTTVTADNSGANGVALTVNSRGLATFDATSSSISSSVLNGMYIDATDANTLVAVNLTNSAINNNGIPGVPSDGLNGTITAGATLNICADTTGAAPMSFSGNTGNGIDVIAGGAGSRIDLDLHQVTVGKDASNSLLGNGLSGVNFQSLDGATINLRSNISHFDGNGTTGVGDGITGVVSTLTANNTIGRLLLIGGTADGNGGDGINLAATNSVGLPTKVTLTAQFVPDAGNTPISASNNGGVGLSFVGTGAGVDANLLMTGGGTFTNDTGGPVFVNVTGADNAIIGLSGTFNGSTTGYGIQVDLSNISGLGLVSLQGPGTVDNNAKGGIEVSLNSVNNGGVFIGGFSSVSGNGTAAGSPGDGISVTMNDVTTGAVRIDSHTLTDVTNVMNINGNGRNGVNVLVNNGTTLDGTVFQTNLGAHLVDLISPVGATMACPTPLPNPLLTLVSPQIDATTALKIPSFTKNPLVITNLALGVNGPGNGTLGTGDGIQVTVDGNNPPTPVTTIVGLPTNNAFTITNNKIYNTASTLAASNQDGLLVQLLNGADVNAMHILGNDIETNNGDGIHVILGGGDPLDPLNTNTAATLALLNIQNNTVLGNTGTVGVSGNGIQLDVNNAPKLATILVNANDVENNKGDGFQMLNPNTGVNLGVTFKHDKFIGNGSIVPPSAFTTYPAGGMGIDIVLNNQNAIVNTINVISDATGANTVSNNASYGLFVEATNQAHYTLNVTGTGPAKNLFDSNTDAGIGVVAGSFVNPDNSLDPAKFSVGNILINDVTVQNTKKGSHPTLPSYPFSGDGIGILTQQYAQMASFVIGTGPSGGNVRNTLLTANQGDGLKINAIENSQFRQTTTNGLGDTAITTLGQATILIQNVDATNNTDGSGNKISHGIEIIRKDNALLSWDTKTNPAAALFIPGNPVSWQAITDTGSFIRLNDVVATGNQGNGLNVSMNNTQFPITRIDIRDTLLNGNSRFDKNLHNGMQFVGTADSITVVNASDTSVSDNNLDGILVQTFNRATFGDVLTAVPLGDPTAGIPANGVPTAWVPGNAIPSTFNGMTISRNGSATSPGGKNVNGNGIEVLANGTQDNGNIDPFNVSSQSAVAISMTGTATHARNLFDSNGGDGVHVTTNRFAFTAINLNKIDMRDTQFTQLGGDGIKVSTNDVSTTTLQLTNASIGYPTASSTQTGLSGNGIEVTTENNSTMNLFIGDQTIASPNPTNAPDVSIYGNKLNGILVKNNGASDFYGQVYDTASRFNGLRGYSAQLTEISLDVHQIDNSVFSDNSMEGIAVIANAARQSGAFDDVSDVPVDPAFVGAYNPYHYLNLNTATKAGFVLTNSTVSNNGGTTPYVGASKNVNGLEIDVSTYAYVSADLRNNTFHGNTLDDVATASFQARTGGGAARGFNADGTIMSVAQGATLLNTPNSIDEVVAGVDRIFLEDTAQLDMRMLHNTGDQISISSGGSNNPNMGATGAVVSDQSGAKFGLGSLQTSIFQVNAYHYDTVNSVTSNNVFTGTNVLPLDGIPTGIVQDAVNFPGPTTIGPPPLFTVSVAARDLEAGLVNQDGFYTNPSAMPPLLSSPPATAFTQVRIDDVTPANQSTGTGANGVIAYNGTTGQFTLAGAGAPGITVGDTFRVHILDTNTFNQFGKAQDVEAAFNAGFQSHSIRIPVGSDPLSTAPGTYYTTNPLSAYFDFPSISFPPN